MRELIEKAKAMGLSPRVIARALDVSERTAHRWFKGGGTLPVYQDLFRKYLDRMEKQSQKGETR